MSNATSRILLDIGLPKTGTTYHQFNIYPFLDPKCIAYNPGDIIYPLREVLPSTRVIKSEKEIEKTKRNIKNTLAGSDRTILISDESMSVDGYCPYYEENLIFLAQLFPGAEILLTVRNQIDWCRSMYKQSVHQGNIQHERQFFCFESSQIGETKNWYENSKERLPRLDVYEINWPKMIQACYDHFGKHHVHVFLYEEFSRSKESAVKRLEQCLGAEMSGVVLAQYQNDLKRLSDKEFHARWSLTKKQAQETKVNRSLSMFAIRCSILYSWIRLTVGLGKIPYRLTGQTTTESGTKLARLHTWWFWRTIWQRHLDTMFYLDWDCMSRTSWEAETTEFFYHQNVQLSRLLDNRELPEEYFDFKVR